MFYKTLWAFRMCRNVSENTFQRAQRKKCSKQHMYQSQPCWPFKCTSYIPTMLSIPDDIWRALYIEFSEDCLETPLTAAKSAFATTCDTTDMTHHACRHPTLPPVEENLTRVNFVCCRQLQCKARFASPITLGTPVYSHGPTVAAASILFLSS